MTSPKEYSAKNPTASKSRKGSEGRAQPHPQPLWVYKREPAGMGEWCYHIYRNNHYMLYAESESIAMIICNGLNRDEQAHTSATSQRIDALTIADDAIKLLKVVCMSNVSKEFVLEERIPLLENRIALLQVAEESGRGK